MKNDRIKVLIICIDIIAVIGLIYTFCVWIKNNKNNIDNTKEETTTKTVIYKKFTFYIPSEVEYSPIDEYKFKLKGEDYEAVIEIFLDNETNMLNYPEIFYNDLIKAGKNVDNYEIITVNEQNVVTYKLHEDNNSTLCYVKGIPEGFAYEINLYNNNNTFDTSRLKEIIDILYNCTYNHQTEKTYNYYKWTFYEEVNALNNNE